MASRLSPGSQHADAVPVHRPEVGAVPGRAGLGVLAGRPVALSVPQPHALRRDLRSRSPDGRDHPHGHHRPHHGHPQPSRRLRAEGKVPGVVYGLGADPIPVTVEWRELRACLITEPASTPSSTSPSRARASRSSRIVKDMQRHPIRHTVLHVDFLLIRRDQEITVDVPAASSRARPPGCAERGRHGRPRCSTPWRSTPSRADIPDRAHHRHLGAGDRRHHPVGDIILPAGVTTDVDPEEVIASAQVSRAAIEAEAIEAADAEVAAEQAEEAADEAPAEGGDAAEGDAAGRRRGLSRLRRWLAPAPAPSRSAGTPWPTCSWSAWATPGRSTPAPATTAGPTSSRCWPSVTAASCARCARSGPRRRDRPHRLRRVALAVPQTYYNDSGLSVAAARPAPRHRGPAPRSSSCTTSSTCPPGTLKVKVGGGLAGNNGLKSIKAHLHTDDFVRVRIGVGKPPGSQRAPTTSCAVRARPSGPSSTWPWPGGGRRRRADRHRRHRAGHGALQPHPLLTRRDPRPEPGASRRCPARPARAFQAGGDQGASQYEKGPETTAVST